MICPTCNTPMNHLNRGGGFTGTEAYQTWDFLECPICLKTAVEFYHTEFVNPDTSGSPKFSIGSDIIADKFEVVNCHGEWMARGTFEEMDKFLEGSKANKYLVKGKTKLWKIQRSIS